MIGLVIIFLLVALLAIFGLVRSIKDKNLLGAFFAFGSLAVFGWFAIMTIIYNGFPVVAH